MKLVYIALILLVTTSCTKKGQEVKTKNSIDNFKVERLFTVDGCNMYRFYDHGSSRYFSSCRGSTQWSESDRSVEIETKNYKAE